MSKSRRKKASGKPRAPGAASRGAALPGGEAAPASPGPSRALQKLARRPERPEPAAGAATTSRLQALLSPPARRLPRWTLLAMLLVAWTFGLVVRLAWAPTIAEQPGAEYQGELLLTTQDAYYYASGVERAVHGTLAENRRVPGPDESVLVAIGAAVSEVFGVAVPTVAAWMPVVLAPLLALPLLLIGRLFEHQVWGFSAALIAVLGYSYWNRTLPGYFDTDMLSVTFPWLIVAALIWVFRRGSSWPGAVAGALVAISPWVHPGSERVLAALAVMTFGYGLVFARSCAAGHRAALAMAIAFLPIPWPLRVAIIVALEVALTRRELPARWLLVAAGATLVVVVALSPAMHQLLGAVGVDLRGGGSGGAPDVRYVNVGQTVLEQKGLDLHWLAERVAGGTALLALALVGYAALALRYRAALLLLPFLALGLVLGRSGLRYTIYAVPLAALGATWAVFVLGHVASRLASRSARAVRVGLTAAGCALLLWPALSYALDYRMSPVIIASEAALMEKLGDEMKPGDYVVGWWDYGYALWFFTGGSTLVDGTKQNYDTWIVSEIFFTDSQREAATLAKLAADKAAAQPDPLLETIDELLRDWRGAGHAVSDFVPALRDGRIVAPDGGRGVFLYLPWRMTTIANVVARFRRAGGLDPNPSRPPPFIAVAIGVDLQAERLKIPNTPYTYDQKAGVLRAAAGQAVAVKHLDVIEPGAGGVLQRQQKELHPEGSIYVILQPRLRAAIFLDEEHYRSVLTQLLFLASPDPRYFEILSYGGAGAIVRVK